MEEKSKMQVHYKNGNINNNDVRNLEWVTASENVKHSYRVLGKAKVKLLHNTPLEIMQIGIDTCWATHPDDENGSSKCLVSSDNINLKKIDRVVNKFKHQSTAEAVSYNFYISNISRACLIELTRHRMASLSVKSTRYTMTKELKHEPSFIKETSTGSTITDHERANKYIVLTGNTDVDNASIEALERLRILVAKGISGDIVKFAMPECYKTELTWTINARSLMNLLKLRTDKAALWEIRELAYSIYEALPEDHKFLYTEYLYNDKG